MTASLPPQPKRLQLNSDVATDDQARELSAAWEEIMERARTSLQAIAKAIEEHPGTGQAGWLVRFLAGAYNSHECPVDLTDLRSLDADLANAYIDYLNCDRLSKAKVHTHLPDGDRQMQWFISQHRLRPRLQLSSNDDHGQRQITLAERLGREPDGLLKQALEYLLGDYEAKQFAFSRLTCHECQSLVLHP